MSVMEYKTVKQEASDEFVEKRSRFIGHIKPVVTEEEAIAFVEKIRKKYWDATHNVYAYILQEGQIKRYSDDNEPKGTAGIPTLDVLQKENLTDCVVVVTRYFGGILLGAGGLVRAYSHGAKIAVDAGKRIRMRLRSLLTVTCDYGFYGKLSTLIPQMEGIIEDTLFTENVTVLFSLPLEGMEPFQDKLTDVSNGSFTAQVTGQKYVAEPID